MSVQGPCEGENWIIALGQMHSQVSLCHSLCSQLQIGKALKDISCSQLFPEGREVPWPTAEPGDTSTNSLCLWFKPQLWPEHGTVPTLAGVSSHLQGAVTVDDSWMHQSSSALSTSERCRCKRKYKDSSTEGHTSSVGRELAPLLPSQPTCAANIPEPPQPHSNFSSLT